MGHPVDLPEGYHVLPQADGMPHNSQRARSSMIVSRAAQHDDPLQDRHSGRRWAVGGQEAVRNLEK